MKSAWTSPERFENDVRAFALSFNLATANEVVSLVLIGGANTSSGFDY